MQTYIAEYAGVTFEIEGDTPLLAKARAVERLQKQSPGRVVPFQKVSIVLKEPPADDQTTTGG